MRLRNEQLKTEFASTLHLLCNQQVISSVLVWNLLDGDKTWCEIVSVNASAEDIDRARKVFPLIEFFSIGGRFWSVHTERR